MRRGLFDSELSIQLDLIATKKVFGSRLAPSVSNKHRGVHSNDEEIKYTKVLLFLQEASQDTIDGMAHPQQVVSHLLLSLGFFSG